MNAVSEISNCIELMSVTQISIDVASSIWVKVASLMPIVATVDNNIIVMIAYLKSYCISKTTPGSVGVINTEGLIIYNNHQALVISTLILQPILVKLQKSSGL